MSTRLLVSQRDGVLLLALDSDDGYPRLESAILNELAAKVSHLASVRELVGAVITGTERAFATGAEITEIASLAPAEAIEFAQHGQSVMRAIDFSPKPIVAAIRGFCMGGGLDLALACRARIASPDAVFAHPGGSLGIITGWGGTQRLPRLIGRNRAIELLSTGGRLGAMEALDCGLLNRVVTPEELAAESVREALRLSVRG